MLVKLSDQRVSDRRAGRAVRGRRFLLSSLFTCAACVLVGGVSLPSRVYISKVQIMGEETLTTELTEEEANLYDRQIRLWGLESQKR